MNDSIQHKIGRNRPPRVQITYDVETGNAIKKQELPFVVGVMADLSRPAGGAHTTKLKDVDRKFVEIDRDNFASYLKSLSPKVAGGSGKEAWEVSITSMDDFGPDRLVQTVPLLKDLYEKRRSIRDLLTKLDGNDAAHEKLSAAYESGGLQQLITDAAAEKAKADAEAAETIAGGTAERGTADGEGSGS
ncbi:type VI secretion system contractile sheath small subunit [Sphingomonas sp. 37zxx]|uniref:type VI secretion system contractile sheath small subunit n=1 Tax=Sphingomonas sp. 37zxx TaxID=1550073 RepID=UPI0006910E4F|nr:type VI secretion system contractile sheath small subunit [Sphingomonas sp. 37zxx]